MQIKEDINPWDYKPLAFKIANEYCGKGIIKQELYDAALIALPKAYTYWIPYKGRFATVVHLYVTSEITALFKAQKFKSKPFNMYVNYIELATHDLRFNDTGIGAGQALHMPVDKFDINSYLDKKKQVFQMPELLNTLSLRSRYIIETRYLSGADNLVTLDVLSKTLGISKERVRQLESKAITKMRLHV